MAKGYCEKRAGKECSKCFREDGYKTNELPCKYFVYNSRGYEGTLKDIKGTKIRRQWFFTPMVMSSWLIVMITVAFFIIFVTGGSELSQEDREFLPILLSAIFFIELFMLILSVLNAKFFGKTVAVVNDSGVYTNQMFLKWSAISEIEFSPRVIYEHNTDEYAYVKIVSGKKIYKVAHMPLYFLLKAKRYNPEIKIKINKKTAKLYIIISSIFIIVPIIIGFIDS